MFTVSNEHEDPYPSLSDYHDYEPNLEFDDTELQHATAEPGTLQSWFLHFHYFYCNSFSNALEYANKTELHT